MGNPQAFDEVVRELIDDRRWQRRLRRVRVSCRARRWGVTATEGLCHLGALFAHAPGAATSHHHDRATH